MYDEKHIKPVLDKVGKLWFEKHRDRRINQHMHNFLYIISGAFYEEEEAFAEKLISYLDLVNKEELINESN